jgi:hypothetical protein
VVDLVVIYEGCLSLIFKLLSLCELAVEINVRFLSSITIWIYHWDEGSKQKRLDLYNRVPVFLELLLNLVLEETLELFMISFTDESIRENSQTFMGPELDHVIFGFNSLWRGFADTLEYFAHVSQVISVMRFFGCGSEVLLDHFVDADCVADNTISHALNSFWI